MAMLVYVNMAFSRSKIVRGDTMLGPPAANWYLSTSHMQTAYTIGSEKESSIAHANDKSHDTWALG